MSELSLPDPPAPVLLSPDPPVPGLLSPPSEGLFWSVEGLLISGASGIVGFHCSWLFVSLFLQLTIEIEANGINETSALTANII